MVESNKKKAWLLYLGNKALKFFIVSLAVFTGLYISNQPLSELVLQIKRYHDSPLKILDECKMICERPSSSFNTPNKQWKDIYKNPELSVVYSGSNNISSLAEEET